MFELGAVLSMKHKNRRGLNRIRVYGSEWEVVEDMGDSVRLKPLAEPYTSLYTIRIMLKENDPCWEVRSSSSLRRVIEQ